MVESNSGPKRDDRPQTTDHGPGTEIVVRPMHREDLAAGHALCYAAGWNQLPADWEFFWAANPEGCFVAESDGRVVGTVTTIDYHGLVSWIAMVLVDPSMRRKGIGTRLLDAVVGALQDCQSIKLDATPAGKKVYDRLGFVDEYGLCRMVCDSLPPVPLPPQADAHIRPMSAADLAGVISFDAKTFGVPRPYVIRGFLEAAAEYAFVASDARDQLVGFCLGRHGERFEQIGPVAATQPNVATSLTQTALAALAGRSVVLDVLLHSPDWQQWLGDLGFAAQRPLIRMFRGSNNTPGTPTMTYAIAGPELG